MRGKIEEIFRRSNGIPVKIGQRIDKLGYQANYEKASKLQKKKIKRKNEIKTAKTVLILVACFNTNLNRQYTSFM